MLLVGGFELPSGGFGLGAGRPNGADGLLSFPAIGAVVVPVAFVATPGLPPKLENIF